MRRAGLGATVFLLAAAVLLPGQARAAERRALLVASGEVTGYYFPEAGAVCRVLNKDKPHGLGCAVLPSSGSAANLAALRSGEADLAVVQSKAASLAVTGEEGFKEAGPMPELRALMALHGEVTVVLARPGAGIEQISDLKGKRVNLGRPGSFQRTMAETVIEGWGVSIGDLSPIVELDLGEQGPELCQGNIDAAVFTGVHPMPEVAQAVEECGATLVAGKAKTLDQALRRNPWLARLTVPGGTYENQKQDLPALGLKALLVTTTKVSAEDAYDVVKAVYGNFPAFTHLHPALRHLNKGEAARDGIPVRLHEGAEKFFTEAGVK